MPPPSLSDVRSCVSSATGKWPRGESPRTSTSSGERRRADARSQHLGSLVGPNSRVRVGAVVAAGARAPRSARREHGRDLAFERRDDATWLPAERSVSS